MDENILISIVIPHMNQPRFLERCLSSLEAQRQHDVEIIVVDNGSRELPVEVCKKHNNIKLELEKTPGPGPARSRGVEVARGDVLAFIDADCVAHPGWLAAIKRTFLENHDTRIVGGDVRIGLMDAQHPTKLEAYESVFAYRQKEYIEKMHFSGTGNLAMRRAAYQHVGAFAGIGTAEDRDWGRRAHVLNETIFYDPNMIVYHPARKSYDELKHKWNHHIAHDFNTDACGAVGRLKWLARTLAVAASAIVDIRKTLTSNRLGGAKMRFDASVILFQIRIYRALYMARLLFSKPGSVNPTWNAN